MNKVKILIFLLSSLVILSCNSTKKYNTAIATDHSVKELHKDIDFTFKKIKRLHPNLYWHISKAQLQHKIDSVKNSITQPMNSKEFFFVLSPLVSEIRQGHNSVGFPFERLEKDELKKYRKSTNYFDKLKFESIEGKIIISEIYDTIKALQYAELLQIDEFKIDDLVAKYNYLRSSDGYNTTFYERRVGIFLKSYYKYENPRLDSVTLKLSLNDSIFDTTFYRDFKLNDTAKKEVKDSLPSDSTEKEELSKLELKAKKKKEKEKRIYETIRGYSKKTKTYTRDYKFLEEDTTIAYLKVRGFMNGPYESLYDEFFAKVDSNQSSTVVLDLRDNLGGRLVEIHYLMGYLAKEEFITIEKMEAKTSMPRTNGLWSSNNSNPLLLLLKTVITPFMFTYEQVTSKKEDGIYYHKMKASKPTLPHENAFKGDVYVLVNGNSFSASSIISTCLQGSERATIVGEETGGTYNGTVAGVFKPIKLKNSKLKLQFGLGMIKAPYTQKPDGLGVIPDVEILPTLIDRKNGEDTELNWVIEKVKSNRKVEDTQVEDEIKETQESKEEEVER